jgi:uncharacterized membrane protein YGL010W
MSKESKLMDMLTGYASAHQHPFNVAVHMVGIPTIMLGVFIVLSWFELGFRGFVINGAYIATLILFVFYLTLDVMFSIVFLLVAAPIAWFATVIGAQPIATSGAVAAATFFGGYAAQFVGHAVEKSVPVVLKHPVQANLAAPFFTVVEIFKIFGLRDDLFNEVQRRIAKLHDQQAT